MSNELECKNCGYKWNYRGNKLNDVNLLKSDENNIQCANCHSIRILNDKNQEVNKPDKYTDDKKEIESDKEDKNVKSEISTQKDSIEQEQEVNEVKQEVKQEDKQEKQEESIEQGDSYFNETFEDIDEKILQGTDFEFPKNESADEIQDSVIEDENIRQEAKDEISDLEGDFSVGESAGDKYQKAIDNADLQKVSESLLKLPKPFIINYAPNDFNQEAYFGGEFEENIKNASQLLEIYLYKHLSENEDYTAMLLIGFVGMAYLPAIMEIRRKK